MWDDSLADKVYSQFQPVSPIIRDPCAVKILLQCEETVRGAETKNALSLVVLRVTKSYTLMGDCRGDRLSVMSVCR